ncbi:MAG TPA: PilZ domain-containing protein [Pseudobdellovibrionaceae bacterium]|nr:PilZ domain-containing protein [Pseudobdellovibrionaceae bacterium]
MRQKPWSIIILAIAHFIAPIGNIFLSSYVNSIGIWENLVDRIQPHNYADTVSFILIPIVSGYLILICRKWSFFLYIGLMVYTLVTATIFWYQQSGLLTAWPIVMVYLINIGVVSYFFIPAVRAIYFDPRLRWWESKPRYNFEKEVQVSFEDQKTKGMLKNISEGGAFITMTNPPKDNSLVVISFENLGVQFEIPAESIIHDRLKELGIGLKFQHTDVTLKQVKTLIETLHKEGKLIEARRPSSEEAFDYWAKQVLTFKGGFIPKINK